jgi:subtilisin family serine protease
LERNTTVVAAAGNEVPTSLAFPAAYRDVLSVGAVDAENSQAYFSNSGETLSLSAPGVGIISAYDDGQYVLGSGTSQATAITSGVVAALLSQGYPAGEIARVLQENALPTGAPQEQVGAGVIQIP